MSTHRKESIYETHRKLVIKKTWGELSLSEKINKLAFFVFVGYVGVILLFGLYLTTKKIVDDGLLEAVKVFFSPSARERMYLEGTYSE
jgi:hypothetical protein